MITDNDITLLKEEIIKLKEKNDVIHINVKPHQRKRIFAESKITAIYDRFFYVSSKVGAYEESFAITYISVLTKNVLINELNI